MKRISSTISNISLSNKIIKNFETCYLTHSSSCIFGFPEIWGTPLRISGLFVTQPIASANLVSVIMEVGIGNHRLIAALVNLHARNSRMTWKNCEKKLAKQVYFCIFLTISQMTLRHWQMLTLIPLLCTQNTCPCSSWTEHVCLNLKLF